MSLIPYAWRCHICSGSNEANTDRCLHCGGPAVITGSQIRWAKESKRPISEAPESELRSPFVVTRWHRLAAVILGVLSSLSWLIFVCMWLVNLWHTEPNFAIAMSLGGFIYAIALFPIVIAIGIALGILVTFGLLKLYPWLGFLR